MKKRHMTIPIKEGGKTYGAISTTFARKYPDIKIPEVAFRQAKTILVDKEKSITATFIGYWSETSPYTAEHIMGCTGRVVRSFGMFVRKNMLKIDCSQGFLLSLPMFKGIEKSEKCAVEVENEIQQLEMSTSNTVHYDVEFEITVLNKKSVPYL